MALYEISAHPDHDSNSIYLSLVALDEVITALALSSQTLNQTIASYLPPTPLSPTGESFTSRVAQGLPEYTPGPQAPLHPLGPQPHDLESSSLTLVGSVNLSNPSAFCHCGLSLPSSQVGGRTTQSAFSWSAEPRWDPKMSVSQIRREEVKRLCWTALTLVAAHTAHCAAFHLDPPNPWFMQAENVGKNPPIFFHTSASSFTFFFTLLLFFPLCLYIISLFTV